MTARLAERPMGPQQYAQWSKRGRGFMVTRNSATLCDTDHENVALEITLALNERAESKAKIAALVAALEAITRTTQSANIAGKSLYGSEVVKAARAALALARQP